MQAVSADFLGVLRIPHVVAIQATIERPGQAPVVVPVVGGHVTMDASAAVRRRGTLVLPYRMAPDPADRVEVADLPYGSYAVLQRGVRYGDGSVELVTLGRLRIDSVSGRETDATATLELSDRMAQVAQEPLLSPFVPTTGATQAIRALVYAVFGNAIQYHLLTNWAAEAVIADAAYTDDRQKAIQELAATIHAEAFFDAFGDLVVRPIASGASVWTIDAGENGVLVDVDESLDRTETVNGVMVVGQATAASAPISSLATDNDPTSPTRWGGPYGKAVKRLESAAVQTQAQADALAAAELERRLALGRNLTVTSVPNPALEPGDVVTVIFRGDRTEDQKIVGLTVPLEASAAIELVTRASSSTATQEAFQDAREAMAERRTIAVTV